MPFSLKSGGEPIRRLLQWFCVLSLTISWFVQRSHDDNRDQNLEQSRRRSSTSSPTELSSRIEVNSRSRTTFSRTDHDRISSLLVSALGDVEIEDEPDSEQPPAEEVLKQEKPKPKNKKDSKDKKKQQRQKRNERDAKKEYEKWKQGKGQKGNKGKMLIEKILANPHDKCSVELKFSPEVPRDMGLLDYCEEHSEYTCCERPHTKRIVSKITEHGVDYMFQTKPTCASLTSKILCSYCDGDVGIGHHSNKDVISLCPSICDAWYQGCKDAQWTIRGSNELVPCNHVDVGCKPLGELVSNSMDFCESAFSSFQKFEVSNPSDEPEFCHDGVPSSRTKRGIPVGQTMSRPTSANPTTAMDAWRQWMNRMYYRIPRQYREYVPYIILVLTLGCTFCVALRWQPGPRSRKIKGSSSKTTADEYWGQPGHEGHPDYRNPEEEDGMTGEYGNGATGEFERCPVEQEMTTQEQKFPPEALYGDSEPRNRIIRNIDVPKPSGNYGGGGTYY